MAPAASQVLLSPAELAYLHSSLSLSPPVRSDARLSTQFRPMAAETGILPGTNGSARICFADGTEALVGIKAEVEQTPQAHGDNQSTADVEMYEHDSGANQKLGRKGKGERNWVEMSIEIPGYRDDDPLPMFLAALLNEPLQATNELVDKLWINKRFHWRLYIDILMLSPPLSYPVPLLSLTTYLALVSTRLPALVSEGDEDPFFNDDWEASLHLYPSPTDSIPSSRPPFALLVVSVGGNVLFDPSREELAVADCVLAISFSSTSHSSPGNDQRTSENQFDLLTARTIDPPSRFTTAGVPDYLNTATALGTSKELFSSKAEFLAGAEDSVWRPPRGGMPRGLVSRVIEICIGQGVVQEVLTGLEAFSGS